MNIPDSISPTDTVVLQHLKEQAKIGEQGFIVYYRGDEGTGSEIIQQAFNTSSEEVKTLKNSFLRSQAEHLLHAMNESIQNYINQPSSENLSALKDGAAEYKHFLNKY